MGISGLLPFIKNACRKGNILELRGKSVAVDVSCLLHRGLTGCMDKIHMGEDTKSYISYVERYIKELLAIGCHVVLVFDGRPLPAKKNTNDERREMREKRKEHAELLMAKGMEREARDALRMATTISADIVENTIRHFRTQKLVDVVVAPYEADAQLAYLMVKKLVDAVITEDSDLIVFGCEKIYFKWQAANGECDVYEKSNLKKCFSGELGGEKFDFSKFRRICILAGCDYLPNGLPGVGLNTAVKFFAKTSIKDLRTLLRKIPSYLNNAKLKEHITSEFIKSFERAENTFKHQIVFDPRERCQTPLTPYPVLSEEIIDLDDEGSSSSSTPNSQETGKRFAYAGEVATQRISIRLALGNPPSENAIDDKFLLSQPTPEWSVWGLRYESKGSLVEKLEKKKEEEATICGAFKLDSPALKRVPKKPVEKIDDTDDFVKQFMEDVEREKKLLKKRKNAPEADYSAEKILKKYSAPPEPKKQRVLEMVDDDFSEFFEKAEKLEKIEEKVKTVEPEPAKEPEKEFPELKPAPILRKTVSTPENTKKFQKFKSPLLSHQNSAPPTIPEAHGAKDASKYFKKMENGPPKKTNPFRCPAFVKPKPAENLENSENSEQKSKKTTLLGELDVENEKHEAPPTNYRFVGFKSAGLSRKTTKN